MDNRCHGQLSFSKVTISDVSNETKVNFTNFHQNSIELSICLSRTPSMSNIRQILFTVEVTRANTMYLLQVAIKCISIVRFLLEYSNCWKAIALSIPIGLSLFVQGIYANMYAVDLKKPFGCSAVYCMCNRQSVTSVLTD